MYINIMESLRLERGLPAMPQTEPDLQVVESDTGEPDDLRFLRAAIPSVLTGLYRFSRSDSGASAILNEEQRAGWVTHLFGDNKDTVVERISGYCYYNATETEDKLNELAKNAVRTIKMNIPADADMLEVKKFMTAQQKNILPYLPEGLRIGSLLEDDTYDDDTHKTNDFFSNLMHSLGNKFTADEKDKDITEPNI